MIRVWLAPGIAGNGRCVSLAGGFVEAPAGPVGEARVGRPCRLGGAG